jgi:sensor domain CHASE-containing protein
VRPPTASRIITTFAVGFLALDALLFAIAGRFIPAAVCAVSAVLVILAWRRYRRALAELADARQEMKREAESLRELLETHLRN